jgi:hypothetical protein
MSNTGFDSISFLPDGPGVPSESASLPSTPLPLNILYIPTPMIDSNGWLRSAEGPLIWVPEDCRNGLSCPAITTIPNTGRHRSVRIDFTRFRFGVSWTRIRGSHAGSDS